MNGLIAGEPTVNHFTRSSSFIFNFELISLLLQCMRPNSVGICDEVCCRLQLPKTAMSENSREALILQY